MLTTKKPRPAVDPRVFDLAQFFIEQYQLDRDHCFPGDCLEDVAWDLADEMQHALEGFLNAADGHRIKPC